MRLLLFFIAVCVVAALRANRYDRLPRTRWVLALVVVVSVGYLSQSLI
jgi:hypothetical protein